MNQFCYEKLSFPILRDRLIFTCLVFDLPRCLQYAPNRPVPWPCCERKSRLCSGIVRIPVGLWDPSKTNPLPKRRWIPPGRHWPLLSIWSRACKIRFPSGSSLSSDTKYTKMSAGFGVNLISTLSLPRRQQDLLCGLSR